MKNIWVIFILIFSLAACVPPAPKEEEQGQQRIGNNGVPTPIPTATPTLAPELSCRLVDLGLNTSLGSPTTIRAAVDLINALPKPTSLRCFLQSLNKPLSIYLTTSNLSVQPGNGQSAPRVFIMKSWLTMSIALSGDASWYLEFAEFYTTGSSFKGEVRFPVGETISYSEPFDRIESNSGTPGTTCRGCHGQEVLGTYPNVTNAYRSVALRPESFNDVSIASFNINKTLCQQSNDQSRRCQMIEAIFDNSTNGNGVEAMPSQASFPLGTPTLFESISP